MADTTRSTMGFNLLSILLGALALGAAHAFEVDHLTAVSAFVARKPSPRAATLFGVKWAVGHGLSLLLLGSVLYLMKLTLAHAVAQGLERLVGVALFLLGCWTLYQLRHAREQHAHIHVHEDGIIHTHHHAHQREHAHAHPHHSLGMGILHGAAGTAAFVSETIVAVSQSYTYVLLFTLAFSLGVLCSMAFYAGMLGRLLTWGEHRAASLTLGLRMLTGVWACLLGIYWIIKPF